MVTRSSTTTSAGPSGRTRAAAQPRRRRRPPRRFAARSAASRPDWSASPRCCASRPTVRTGRIRRQPPDGPSGQGARRVEPSFPDGRGRRRHRNQDHRLVDRHPADRQQLAHRRCQSIAEQRRQHQRLVLLVGTDQPAVDVVVRPGGRRQREPGRGRGRRGQPRRLGLQVRSAGRTGTPPRGAAAGAPGAEEQVGRRRPPTPRPLTHGPVTHPASLASPHPAVRRTVTAQPGPATALTSSSSVSHCVLPSRQVWPELSSTTTVWLFSSTDSETASQAIGSPTAVIEEAS